MIMENLGGKIVIMFYVDLSKSQYEFNIKATKLQQMATFCIYLLPQKPCIYKSVVTYYSCSQSIQVHEDVIEDMLLSF